jgi:hypothetical protein
VASMGVAITALAVLTDQARAAAVAETPVNQEAIVVSLPVFIASLGAAIGFTWVVAQWDAKRSRRLENLERLLIERGLVKPSNED